MRTKHKNSHQDKNKTKSKNILLLPKKIIFLLKHGGMNITKKLNALFNLSVWNKNGIILGFGVDILSKFLVHIVESSKKMLTFVRQSQKVKNDYYI